MFNRKTKDKSDDTSAGSPEKPPTEHINSSYRAAFGGPGGIPSETWTAGSFGPRPSNAGRRPTPAQGIVPGLSTGEVTPSKSSIKYSVSSSGHRAPFATEDDDVGRSPSSLPKKKAYSESTREVECVFGEAAALAVAHTAYLSSAEKESPGGSTEPSATEEQLAVDLATSVATKASTAAAAATRAIEAAHYHSSRKSSTTDRSSEVRSLLSVLVSGGSSEQISAANQLKELCGGDEASCKSVASNGGVHTLHLCIQSSNAQLRDSCTHILTDVYQTNDTLAFKKEIIKAPGGIVRFIETMLLALENGQASAGGFLAAIAGVPDDAAKTAFSRCKAVKRIAAVAMDKGFDKIVRLAALEALEAFANVDPVHLKKIAWSGGLQELACLLSQDAIIHPPVLRILLKAVSVYPEFIDALATPDSIPLLSKFIGCPNHHLSLQVTAGAILALVSGLPVLRTDASSSMIDTTLPRACEVLHDEDVTTPDELRGSCAAIVAHLMQRSAVCCHVVMYHTAVLKTTLNTLITTKQFLLAEKFLVASAAFAQEPGCDITMAGS